MKNISNRPSTRHRLAILAMVAVFGPFAANTAFAAWAFEKGCSAENRKAIDGATSGLFAQVNAASGVVSKIQAKSLSQTSPSYKEYVKWFGAPDNAGQNATTVKGHLDAVAEKLSERKNPVTARCNPPPPDCDPGDYASTANPWDYIAFCGSFFTAPDSGDDTKKGAVLHELTHMILNTKDHVYGQQAAMKLAASTPQRALQNADSYEYFVEGLGKIR